MKQVKNQIAINSRRPAWVLLIEGFLGIILGSLLIWAPAKTKQDTWLILVIILGLYWLISGILTIAHLFQNQKRWEWKLFGGIISTLAGLYILIYPAVAAAALPNIILLILGAWGVVMGTIRISLGFLGEGWGYAIWGVLMLILGIILVINWTNPSWGLGLLYACATIILLGGIALIVLSFRIPDIPIQNEYMS